LYFTEGRKQEVVSEFSVDLMAHGRDPNQIEQTRIDMLPVYIKGINDCCPNAEITFDCFHMMKILNFAVDQVRREEAKTRKDLKKPRCLYLKNPSNLTGKQK